MKCSTLPYSVFVIDQGFFLDKRCSYNSDEGLLKDLCSRLANTGIQATVTHRMVKRCEGKASQDRNLLEKVTGFEFCFQKLLTLFLQVWDDSFYRSTKIESDAHTPQLHYLVLLKLLIKRQSDQDSGGSTTLNTSELGSSTSSLILKRFYWEVSDCCDLQLFIPCFKPSVT